MKFSIVVPAYNEERGVEGILRRCVAAEERIRAAGVDRVEVILVDDGSTDRTKELAASVEGVRVLSHPRNRGYGAAIKTGFDAAEGELLGFLDADGTCAPEFFAELLKALQARGLDVALGSRLHEGSRMPRLRRIGNLLFRALVNRIGGSSMNDVASGMRVVRREALHRLYPLPDGLHFTPAMTVRAVLDGSLSIGEVPMPYEERVGRSKLRVVQDGFGFLFAILEVAVTYRPLLFFGTAALLFCALAAAALGFALGGPSAPLLFYLRHRRLEDWMIFRIALVTLLLSLAGFLVALGAAAQFLASIINREETPSCWTAWAESALRRRLAWLGGAGLAFSVLVNRRLLASYWTTGQIPGEFWVFPLVGSLFALAGAQFLAFALLGRIAALLRERERLRRPAAR